MEKLFNKKITERVREKKGITLIALIITIIILVILTAVTINNVIGSNLIGFATKAAEDYIDAAEEENKLIQKTMALSAGKATAEDSIVQPGVEVTSETETKGEEGEIKYNYTDVMGRHAMVPEGFKVSTKVSEQFIEDGLVIQDEDGNEFVWVPCYVGEKPDGTADDVQQYEKHKYETQTINDTSDPLEDTGNGYWKTIQYREYNDWQDEAKDYGTESVKKYGGFYIGRYEAGLPEEKQPKLGEEIQKNNNDTNLGKPLSKRDKFSWNYINHVTAKTVSEGMYNDANYGVSSKLIDGYAWDTVVSWISTDGINLRDSRSYGNNTEANKTYNGKYIEYVIGCTDKEGLRSWWWFTGKSVLTGSTLLNGTLLSQEEWESEIDNYTSEGTSSSSKYFHKRIQIPTGSVDDFELKHIYDLAGNTFEFTTESRTTDSDTFAVLRGGSFSNSGLWDTITTRWGLKYLGGDARIRLPCCALYKIAKCRNLPESLY